MEKTNNDSQVAIVKGADDGRTKPDFSADSLPTHWKKHEKTGSANVVSIRL